MKKHHFSLDSSSSTNMAKWKSFRN